MGQDAGTARRKSRKAARYRAVANALIGDISSGRVGVGERLPGELELTRRFAVSRHTVREALRVLEEYGMIARRAGVGTVVRHDKAPSDVQRRLVSVNEFLHYPGKTRLHVQGSAMVKLNGRLAKLLGCSVGEHRLRLSCVRRSVEDNLAICWTEIYLLPALGAVVAAIGQDETPVYQLIQEMFGENARKVEVQISAILFDQAQADALAVAEGSPSLRVIRRYRNKADRPYLVSVSDHPPDRISYLFSFSPGWDPAPIAD